MQGGLGKIPTLLPRIVGLFELSANIGVHHVHRISSHIPFYRLPKVLRDFPELQEASKLTCT